MTRLDVFAGISVALLLAAAPLSAATDPAALPESAARISARYGDGVLQQGPEELRGEVTSVAGDRIHIRISEAGWLPRAGTPVELGAEVMGIYAPLKGSFVIVQVNADSCIAQHVGNDQPGRAAPGMRAVMKTPYPNRPRSQADYHSNAEQTAIVRPMAEGGNRVAQNALALAYWTIDDHDNALIWWERASTGATERLLISNSATSRARILAIRGEYQQALAILQDAASRTRPRSEELVFSAYSNRSGADRMTAVDSHVEVLMALGDLYRSQLADRNEANRWYRAATEVMAAAATHGAPGPDQPTHAYFLRLLDELANFTLEVLKDEATAVPFFQMAARAGDESAQKTLTRLGHPW